MLTGRRPKSLSLSRSLGIFLTKSKVGSAQRKPNYQQHFLLWLNFLRQRIERRLWAKRIEHCPDPEFSVGQFQGRSKAFELLLISFKALYLILILNTELNVPFQYCHLCIYHWAVLVSNETFSIIWIRAYLLHHQKSIRNTMTVKLNNILCLQIYRYIDI